MQFSEVQRRSGAFVAGVCGVGAGDSWERNGPERSRSVLRCDAMRRERNVRRLAFCDALRCDSARIWA